MDVPRVVAFAAVAMLAAVGLVLGANSQEERFLGPDHDPEFGRASSAAGNIVPLTALVSAAGVMGGALLLSRRPFVPRVGRAAQLAAGTWLLLVLVQSTYPNYDILAATRFARLSISPIVAAHDAQAALVAPLFALFVAAALVVGNALHHLRGDARSMPTGPAADMRRLVAWTCLAMPFLAVTASSHLALLTRLDFRASGYALALVLLPVMAAAAAALLVIQVVRIWQYSQYQRHPVLAPATGESWRLLATLEWIAAGLLAAAALASSFAPRISLDELALGRVFVLDLRSHMQATLLVLLPLLPAILHARRVGRALEAAEGKRVPAQAATRMAAACIAVWVVAATAAALAAFFAGGALTPWLLAAVPCALLAGSTAPGPAAGPAMALGAFALWAQGNTVEAIHDARSLLLLDFNVHPGILALWRLAAVGLLAWMVAKLARSASGPMPPAVRSALCALVGAAAAVVAWLELSLNAWMVPGGAMPDSVGIGPMVRSLPVAVRSTLHAFSVLAAVAGGIALARLLRPDWFRRQGTPSSAPAAVSS